MRKSIVVLGLLGSVVLVGAVLARPRLSTKVGAAVNGPQDPVVIQVPPAPPRPVEAPEGFRQLDRESGTLRAEAPFKLTASDGTGLVLASLDARAVVDGPLAFTELRMVFDNPEGRVLEGRFQTTLPSGASVSRFAMRVGDRWQEGEVVEKKRARRAYEDFLHRKQDPALLEQAAGNEFTARVFPIPAHGRKEIILSYSNEISGEYALPLRGLVASHGIDVRATAGSTGTVLGERHMSAQGPNAPTEDFAVTVSTPRAGGLRSGNLVIARVSPEVDTAPDSLDSTMILVDTSASRGLGFEDQIRFASRLVTSIAKSYPDARIAVACFDQSVTAVYEGAAGGFGDAETAKMTARGALGASNLSQALAWAKGEAQAKKYTRVLLLGDGVATAGHTDPAALKDAVKELATSGILRLDAIAEGGIRDDAALKALVTAGLARDGVVVSSSESFSTLGKKLASRTRSGIAVKVDGASWVSPTRLDGVQPGDVVLVYAEMEEGKTPAVSLGEQKISLELTSAERPLVERAWAKAKIAALSAKLADAREPADVAAVQREIVSVSTKYRVLSPYTALLVLETEQDYRQFDIDRKALSSILTVEDGRLATVSRSWEPKTTRAGAPLDTATATTEEKQTGAAAASAAPPTRMAPAPAAKADKDDDGPSLQPAAKAAAGPGFADALQGAAGQAASPPPAAPDVQATAPSPPRAVARRAPPARGGGDPFGGGALADSSDESPRGAAPYTGTFKTVMDAIAAARKTAAMDAASKWHSKNPGDVMALVALGEALEATGDKDQAARAYGSIIDLFSSRADLRRFAGERLERLTADEAIALAVDTYEKAAEDRPDHPSSHRLLAWALVRSKAYDKAFGVLEKSLARQYPRFEAADRILREDLGIVAKAWAASEPEKLDEITRRLRAVHASLDSGPSLRFVLTWETDANDVDFHIYDSHGGHAFFSNRELPSGGELYADITTGYGPECFAIRAPRWKREPLYTLQAHYYSRGPMGYGMGKLQIIDHDGKGGLKVEDRPFVVMADEAFVNMGVVRR